MRTPAAWQFGVYEFDVETGELLKDGIRLHLQDQPAKILRILLEHPGELVTREQLKQVLSPDTSFGDFDHALNVAVAKLRTALDEVAEKPTYIETLHKRGYRFIAPLNGNVHGVVEPTRRTRLLWWIVLGTAALMLAVTGVFLWPHRSSPPVYEPIAFTTLQGPAVQPAFSPDGSEIAFTWKSDPSAPWRIYVQSIGSVVARPLIDDAEPSHQEFMARWFHDGSRVAYLRQVGSAREVWTVARTGGQPRKLVNLGPVTDFDIAPDDKTIVSSESMPRHAGALFLTSLDSKNRRQLTTPEDKQWAMSDCCAGDHFPIFSPDGKSVAYFHVEGAYIDLLCVPFGGGASESLLGDLSNTSSLVPTFTWAADGKSLIVAAVRNQNPSWGRVWLGRKGWWQRWFQGKNWEPMANTGASYPTVPRDGRRLAFVRSTGFINVWRYGLPRSGHTPGNPLNLTRSSSEDRGPALSPDGTRLSFASNRTGNFEIYVTNNDGSHPVQLTSFQGKDAGSPNWSPDGKQITFDYRPDGHSHIFAIDANGGPARQITFGDADDVLPRYSQDGQRIYFARLRQGGADEWTIPSEGGKPEIIIADSNDVREATDGKTLFVRHLKAKGIYTRTLAGGKERLLFGDSADVAIGPWVAVNDGIYYQQVRPSHQLVFYDFAAGRNRVVLNFSFPATPAPTISIAPDRSYYLEHKADPQSNIMVIENFR